MAELSLVEEWIKMADEDYLWAQASLKEEIFKGACFAAQQSAEKYLKAYIIAHNLSFEKIHDLKRLVGICTGKNKDFEELAEYAEYLTPFYIETRYPGFVIDITKANAEKALEATEQIASFIKSKLSSLS